jgi:diaminohydroxyphosphoribosylaminopyrimidine deaminase / 5-amino-6-(5-phosphoribosylamino)uracil reductase
VATDPADLELMAAALAAADGIQRASSPNPGVGAAIRTLDGAVHRGCTQPPGSAHAEVMAINAARSGGSDTRGATLATTLEPCNHTGRTGPCTEAVIAAGISKVLVGVQDPDPKVAGTGLERLRAAGIEIADGVMREAVSAQLEAYLHHRRTGRPFVTLKLASSMDGRTAAPDRTSKWITGDEARADAHRLRAEHDAILVGAGTVRSDDPTLTVRHVVGPDPVRVVLGHAPAGAKVHPCLEMSGPLEAVLGDLGNRGILTLMIEGGPTVAASFYASGLVDRYVLYVAPVLFGGDDALSMFVGAGAQTIAEVWRGRIISTVMVGGDLRVELRP